MTNDEAIKCHMDGEAWLKLSADFEWTERLLEKYQDKVDWNEISNNREIRWTVPMIKKFAEKINWTKFSAIVSGPYFTTSDVEKFKDYWDWHELS